MKKTLLLGSVLLGTLIASPAAIYYQGTAVTGGTQVGTISASTIYDGNPAYVIANTMNLSSFAAGNNWSLTSLTMTLHITGGMNNGLYGYLIAPDGTTVTLMNQPGYENGFGATGDGMQISLASSGAANGSIQDVTSGSFVGGSSYPAYDSSTSFSSLDGINAYGSAGWTLYFADTLAGGGNATLQGWSLDITAVPEPVNVALGAFGILAVGGVGLRHYWRRKA